MGYESKVILTSIYRYAEQTRDIDRVLEFIADMANSDGTVIKPAAPDKRYSAEQKGKEAK